MKLLLNENISRTVTESLRRAGHDVVWVGDDLAGTEDSSILAKARREERILITKDKDFGELAFKHGYAHSGIILLRLEDERAENTLRVLDGMLDHLAGQKPPYFVVASDREFRVRKD